MSDTTCPVFRPSLEEFYNFPEYIKHIESTGAHLEGICKVIPPGGWFCRSDEYDLSGELGRRMVTKPIRQHMSGKKGAFTLNIVEEKDMSVLNFSRYCEQHRCEYDSLVDIERHFWRTLNSSVNAPFYGADVPGSLFEDEDACGWNVNALDTPMKYLASWPGISSSMLYFGSWRATFAFHTEDFDLYSINYVHTGAPKSWYCIPPGKRPQFESTAAAYFTAEERECKEYLRHKTHILSPSRLKEGGLKFHTVVQQAGEFVITFPGAYHAGFNHGFNIAEATNFATETWIPAGLRARVCSCRPLPVTIDVSVLETHILRDKKENELLQSSSEKEVEDTSEKRLLLRCFCGRAPFKCPSSPPPASFFATSNSPGSRQAPLALVAPVDSVFQCCECDCWCHVACIFPSSPSSAPKDATCHMCRDINASLADGEDEKSTSIAEETTKDNNAEESAAVGNDIQLPHRAQKEAQKAIPSIVPLVSNRSQANKSMGNDVVNGCGSDDSGGSRGAQAKRSCGKRTSKGRDVEFSVSPPNSLKQKTDTSSGVTEDLQEDAGTLFRGDVITASVPRPGGTSRVGVGAEERVEVVGTVTDVLDGHFRLHVKGTHKNQDHWIALTDPNYAHTPGSCSTSPDSGKGAVRKRSCGLGANDGCDGEEGNICDGDQADQLVLLVEASHRLSTQLQQRLLALQLQAQSHGQEDEQSSGGGCRAELATLEAALEGHGPGMHDDFPQYLPQCETLFLLCSPGLVAELQCIHASHEKQHGLKKYLATFQNIFLHASAPSSLISSDVNNCNVFFYDGYHYSFVLLLEILSDDLRPLVTVWNKVTGCNSRGSEGDGTSSGETVTVSFIPHFLGLMSRLLLLSGVEDSVHKLVVEFSKLVQSSMRKNLKEDSTKKRRRLLEQLKTSVQGEVVSQMMNMGRLTTMTVGADHDSLLVSNCSNG